MSLTIDYFAKTKEWTAEYGPNTVVLMQVGAFFEIYGVQEPDGSYSGSRIADVAHICDLSYSASKPGSASSADETNSDKLPVRMAGFRDHQIDKYLRKLNNAGWTCVVYTQDAATKNTTRSLASVFTPGTFFSDDSTSVSNNTMVVWVERVGDGALFSKVNARAKTYIGMAIIDIFTGRSSVAEYCTTERHSPSSYDDLERAYSVYNPSEVIIISSLDDIVVKQISQYTGMDERRVRIVNTNTTTASSSSSSPLQTSNNTTEPSVTRIVKNARNSEKQSYQLETINTFFGNATDADADTDRKEALLYEMHQHVYGFQALVFLLNYIYSHNPNLASRIQPPVVEHHNDKLILANHSLKQLNMIHDDGCDNWNRNTKASSVSSLLNSALTAGGRRTFAHSLHNPTCDSNQLKRHYGVTEECLNTGIWKTTRDKLKDIKDLEKLCRKLVLGRFTPKDVSVLLGSVIKSSSLYEHLQNTDSWPKVRSYLRDCCGVDVDALRFTEIITFVEGNIKADDAAALDSCGFNQYSAECVNKGTCFVKEGVSAELDVACKGGLIWQKQLTAIVEYFASLVAKTEAPKTSKPGKNGKSSGGSKTNKTVKLHETPTMPPTIMLTKRRSAILKLELARMSQKAQGETAMKVVLCEGTVAEFSLDLSAVTIEPASSKSEDVINSSQIRDITYKMRNCKEVFNDILTTVFKDFCHRLLEHIDGVTRVADFVRHIDVIQSRCYVADRYAYCKPELADEPSTTDTPSFVRAVGLRHPLIEHIQTNEIYVTNDLELGGNGHGDDDGNGECDDDGSGNGANTSGILLFGTNAVGKTSIIKALGISVIMAQAGLYVPCSSFTLKPYRSIFTRILGNDNIHRGLSTFAVEMLELRTILKMADKHSLILGDELCSGTESDSALSIFASGVEHLHASRSSFIFATHFHEIVEYDEIKALAPRVKAKHMTVMYDRDLDVLVYDRKLKDGSGDSMYGLEVCKALDLPQTFLERAHSIRGKYNRAGAADTDMGTSHFNRRKVLGRCELCGKAGTEIHHLQHQKNADASGRIKHFHKNHLANLISLCGVCHDEFHESDVQYERKKTTKGYKLMPVST